MLNQSTFPALNPITQADFLFRFFDVQDQKKPGIFFKNGFGK